MIVDSQDSPANENIDIYDQAKGQEGQSSVINRIIGIILLISTVSYYFTNATYCRSSTSQNVINIEYYSPQDNLPINPLLQVNGSSIADFLYEGEQLLRREGFIQERIDFINQTGANRSVSFAQYTLVVNQEMLKKGIKANQKQWQRLQKIYNLSTIKEELPFCILIASFNNNDNFRIEANLNSVFTQNYTNYKAVIINDASTDGTGQTYRKYLQFYRINNSKYTYIQNKKRRTALQNYYLAALNQCPKQSIAMVVDGDDQLIGRNVLQVFNWAFQFYQAGVIYSNFYLYHTGKLIEQGFTKQYTNQQKTKNLYRDVPMKFSHLRAAKTQLFHKLSRQDLQDHRRSYYQTLADQALFFPLMELSCGKVFKIQNQFHLLYNYQTGLNEGFNDFSKGVNTQKSIRNTKKHQCSKQIN